MQKMKLNLGSGINYKEGYVNLDWIKAHKPDIIWDINEKPFPFEDNVFDEVFCSHILEHFDDVVGILQELWRITKKGGRIIIGVPHFASYEAASDLTHRKLFGMNSFYCYEMKDFGYYYGGKMRFRVVEKVYQYSPNKWYMRPFEFIANINYKFTELWLHKIIPMEAIKFELEVLK